MLTSDILKLTSKDANDIVCKISHCRPHSRSRLRLWGPWSFAQAPQPITCECMANARWAIPSAPKITSLVEIHSFRGRKKPPQNPKIQRSKNVHDHHRKKIFWGTFLASKQNFPGRWCFPKTLQKPGKPYLPPKSFLCGSHFVGKEKFLTGAGRCMLSFSQKTPTKHRVHTNFFEKLARTSACLPMTRVRKPTEIVQKNLFRWTFLFSVDPFRVDFPPVKKTVNKQKTLKNTKEIPRKKNTNETKTPRKRRTRHLPPKTWCGDSHSRRRGGTS